MNGDENCLKDLFKSLIVKVIKFESWSFRISKHVH